MGTIRLTLVSLSASGAALDPAAAGSFEIPRAATEVEIVDPVFAA